MSVVPSTTKGTISTDEIRTILNKWCQEGFFRLRRLGDRIELKEIAPLSCVTIKLTTQYEDRQIEDTYEPYHGGPIDDTGRPPALWQMRIETPQNFENRTDKFVVPHTDKVGGCPGCGASGRVTCSTCNGFGKVNCTWCHGSGYRTTTRSVTTTNPQGGTSTNFETVQEHCTSCFMGSVNCTWCHGSGHVTCKDCAGTGKVKFFKQLVATFRYVPADEVVKTGGLPDTLALKAHGEVLIDKSADRINGCDPITPQVDKTIADLLEGSHREEGPETRLHFQQLHVEQVPAFEVTYTYRSDKVRRLWVFGQEKKVHAPEAPRRWLPYLLMMAVAVAAVVGLGIWAFQQGMIQF
jgi:hypothetical protein